MQNQGREVTLLRVVVAFAAGVLLADWLDSLGWHWPTLLTLTVAALLFAAGIIAGLSTHHRSSSLSLTSGICLTLAFVAFGGWALQMRCDAVRTTWPEGAVDGKVRVMTSPDVRQRSTRYTVNMAGHRVYLYVSGEAPTFLPGDSLLLHGVTVREPENFSPDLSFDYARSLLHKGISGTCFVKARDLTVLPSDHRRGVLARSRELLAEKYAHEPLLGEKEQGVIRALTLGDRSALSEELRVDYASAGVSHVLALSGLHVSIVYLLLSFCFRPLFARRNRRWIGELLALLALWVFALLTGASSSIVRAVLMCTIYGVASLAGGDRSPFSALSLAAGVMLCCDPFTLFDVGFELSFASLCAILCLANNKDEDVLQHVPLHKKVLNYVIGIVWVSLVAQAGTLPLTLHYFGRFPTYFLLTNIVVIPLVTVTMLAAVVWWVCTCLPVTWAWPGELLNGCVGLMNRATTTVAELPGSTLSVNDFGWLEVVCAYMVLFFLVRFCRKKPGALVGAVAGMIALAAVRLVM